MGRPEEIHQLVDLYLEGKIILKWILNKLDGGTCSGLFWLRI
jgi:hypothetical protein